MADDGENMFGRDSDSESSAEAEDVGEAALNTAESTAPTRGGAAGGFLGQVESAVAKPTAGSGSSGPGGGGGGEGTDAAPPTEGKALEGEQGEEKEDSPPSQVAEPRKTVPTSPLPESWVLSRYCFICRTGRGLQAVCPVCNVHTEKVRS